MSSETWQFWHIFWQSQGEIVIPVKIWQKLENDRFLAYLSAKIRPLLINIKNIWAENGQFRCKNTLNSQFCQVLAQPVWPRDKNHERSWVNTTRDDISDENVICPREILRVSWVCSISGGALEPDLNNFEFRKVRKMKCGLDSTSKWRFVFIYSIGIV